MISPPLAGRRTPLDDGDSLTDAARRLTQLQFIHLEQAVALLRVQEAKLAPGDERLEAYRQVADATRAELLRDLNREIKERGLIAMMHIDGEGGEPTKDALGLLTNVIVYDPRHWWDEEDEKLRKKAEKRKRRKKERRR